VGRLEARTTMSRLEPHHNEQAGSPHHNAFLEETATALSTTGALLDGFQFRQRAGHGAELRPRRQRVLRLQCALEVAEDECAGVPPRALRLPGRVAALGLMLRPFLPKSSNAILKYFGVSDPFAAGSSGLRPEEIARPASRSATGSAVQEAGAEGHAWSA